MGRLQSLFSAPVDPEEAKQKDYAYAVEQDLKARRECSGAWRGYRDAKTEYLEGVEAACGRMDEIESRRRALLAVTVRHLLLHQSSMLANLQFDTQQAANVAGDAEEAAREPLPPLVPRPSPQGQTGGEASAAVLKMRSRSRTGSQALGLGKEGAQGGSGAAGGGSAGAARVKPVSRQQMGAGLRPGVVQYAVHLAFAARGLTLGRALSGAGAGAASSPLAAAYMALPASVRKDVQLRELVWADASSDDDEEGEGQGSGAERKAGAGDSKSLDLERVMWMDGAVLAGAGSSRQVGSGRGSEGGDASPGTPGGSQAGGRRIGGAFDGSCVLIGEKGTKAAPGEAELPDGSPKPVLDTVREKLRAAVPAAKQALDRAQEGGSGAHAASAGKASSSAPKPQQPKAPDAVRQLVAALDARRSRGVRCGPDELVVVAGLVRLALDAVLAGELHQLGRSLMVLG